MKLADFDYSLLEALIARYPPQQRRDSRLLYLDNNINGELQPPEGGGFNLRLESRLSC
ncbi:MAG: S-adenosylmethionine:tRNA ribosyltransferase-isomerase [Gammaproteobacteria bacterium]|nr:S-adenosylmethionine:tRNA ribosyltransferase-isomerase [Gammaproteobacteria bacterium]